MSTLDAQCLVIRSVGEQAAPNIWRHHRSGSLSCMYENGGTTFTWSPQDVAEMACKWGEICAPVPDAIRSFVDTHQNVSRLIESAGRGAPDTIVHDIPRAELHFVWHDEKVVVIVEDVPVQAA